MLKYKNKVCNKLINKVLNSIYEQNLRGLRMQYESCKLKNIINSTKLLGIKN